MIKQPFHKIITPFLMGQRRDGLARVRDLTTAHWDLLNISERQETRIQEADKRIEAMSEIYLGLSEKIKEYVKQGDIPVSIAGDCVSAIGVLAGLQKADKQPDRVIWLDAHGDFHTWETSQTQYIGGMPLAMLVGRGDQRIIESVGLTPYPEDRIILSDGRDLDPGEREALASSNVIRCDIGSISRYLKPEETIYLHWDTDVINAKEALPALKYHVDPGPGYSELQSFFRSLRDTNLVAVSVSAWHEELDTDSRTAKACLLLLRELGVDT